MRCSIRVIFLNGTLSSTYGTSVSYQKVRPPFGVRREVMRELSTDYWKAKGKEETATEHNGEGQVEQKLFTPIFPGERVLYKCSERFPEYFDVLHHRSASIVDLESCRYIKRKTNNAWRSAVLGLNYKTKHI